MNPSVRSAGTLTLFIGIGLGIGLLSSTHNASAASILSARQETLAKCSCHGPGSGTNTVAAGGSVVFWLTPDQTPSLVGQGISIPLAGDPSTRRFPSEFSKISVYEYTAVIPASTRSQTLYLSGAAAGCASFNYVVVNGTAPVAVALPIATNTPMPVDTLVPVATQAPFNTPAPTTTAISINTNVRGYLSLPEASLGVPMLHPRSHLKRPAAVASKHSDDGAFVGQSTGQPPTAPSIPAPANAPLRSPTPPTLIFG